MSYIPSIPASHNVNAQTGTTYTLALADTYESGRAMNTFSNAGTITVTVPKNASIALPVGCSIPCQQIGAGQVVFAPEDGTVTLNPSTTLKIAAQWRVVQLTQTAANVWSLVGALSS